MEKISSLTAKMLLKYLAICGIISAVVVTDFLAGLSFARENDGSEETVETADYVLSRVTYVQLELFNMTAWNGTGTGMTSNPHWIFDWNVTSDWLGSSFRAISVSTLASQFIITVLYREYLENLFSDWSSSPPWLSVTFTADFSPELVSTRYFQAINGSLIDPEAGDTEWTSGYFVGIYQNMYGFP
ncbi:MAG: hypothetical protein ACFFD4_02230 [Candidatus Odinarchaeota archaeon]